MIAFLRKSCTPRALLLALLFLGLGVDSAISHGKSVAGTTAEASADESAPSPNDHRRHGEEACKRRVRHLLELRLRDTAADPGSPAASPLLPVTGIHVAPDSVLLPAPARLADRGTGPPGQPRVRLKLQLGQAP